MSRKYDPGELEWVADWAEAALPDWEEVALTASASAVAAGVNGGPKRIWGCPRAAVDHRQVD